ncbi:MAG TPA: tetratricopeptide repeat protein [Pirellulales bacterium]
MDKRWGCNALVWLATIGTAPARLLAAEGRDVVIVASESDPQTRLRSSGTIVDYTGRELVLELPSGARRQYPASQVLEIQTQRSPDQTAADELFAKHEFAPALEKYQRAAHAESRRWMLRQILARIVECARESGQTALAGDTFLALVRDDPTTSFFRLIPLAWLPVEPRPELEKRASVWLARPDAPAVLLGASWLLIGAGQQQALARLEGVATSPDPSIAALAEAQTWRVRFAAADGGELAAWRDKLERFPAGIRAGPDLILGRALLFHRQTEPGTMALMRVPILFPDERTLAAEALWLAAEALRAGHQPREAATLYRELATEYPDARWAADARNRLSALLRPVAEAAPAP